jgi:AbiV family abortive infection protein
MQNLSIKQIAIGIQKVLENSRSLIAEAMALHTAGFYARAFTLAHLSREELSKINMLYSAGINLLLEKSVDWKQLRKRFNSHTSKLYSDVFASFINTEMPQNFDKKTHLENMLSCVHGRNNMKNKSLYVGFDGKEFTKPKEIIKEHTSLRTIELAAISLSEYELINESFSVLKVKDKEQLKDQFKGIPDLNNLDKEASIELMLCINELMTQVRKNRQIPNMEDAPDQKAVR